MSSVQTPSPRTQPLPKLAEARAVTLRDHVLNIFRLVIKELRSIRSDPTMLILVVYAFSILSTRSRPGPSPRRPTYRSASPMRTAQNYRGRSPRGLCVRP